MAIKKSALYSSLWKSCDELRGGMDASQYKDYVLTLLFVKYISDRYANKEDSVIEIPAGGSFSDLVALKGNKEIGDKINKAIGKLAEANELKGVIDIADFNDEDKLGKGKEMQDRLSKLISIFNDLDFSSNRADGDDLLGDAYEYLMRHFATESGKSKGQFYTPAEVSRVMAKIIGITKQTRQDQSVYDPTCGSGSLLLKVAHESPKGISMYGQEKDVATTALAKMNTILHGYASAAVIAPGGSSTLSDPYFVDSSTKLKTFDFVVANPPFSTKSWQNGFANDEKKKTIFDPYGRFDYGVPPAKNGDYAFLLHILRSLKSTGKGAVILPHGVLFRGNAEATIRKEIVKRGYIKGIIGLPANLFYGTGIPACIIVLDKENAVSRKGIFMIDASKEYIKDGNKNRLRSQDIHKIVDVFNKSLEINSYSRMVPLSEISDEKNDYNLNLPRYIDSGSDADIHDLTAHLKGGIPRRDIDALKKYWDVFKSTKDVLFKQDNTDYLTAQVPSDKVKITILESTEFKNYSKKVKTVLKKWEEKHEDTLKGLKKNCNPKEVIWQISEDLLAAFANIPLLDKYDIYQHLMNYWSDVMQDDLYQISMDGWKKAAQIRQIIDDKDKKVKEDPDITVGTGKKMQKFKSELIPPSVIIQKFFRQNQQEIDDLESKRESLIQEKEELLEEHSGDEGLLEDAKNGKGELTQASIKARMKEIKGKEDFDDEREVLLQAEKIVQKESEAKTKFKELEINLNKNVIEQYSKLSEDEIKDLVVNAKWFAFLRLDVELEVERVTQTLASRVKELEERYANPMHELINQVTDYSARVDEHLKKMGLIW